MSINVVGKDTSICLSIPKAKYMLKKYYEAAEYRQLNEVCEKQLTEYKQLNDFQSNIIANQVKIISNDSTAFTIKDKQLVNLNIKYTQALRATKRQTTYKWIAIGAGALLSGFLGYQAVKN